MSHILEVWRGREILSMDSRLVDLRGMITSSGQVDPEHYTSFIHNLQLHSKYSGSDCINSFHADKKIRLLGCGFFGPLPSKSVGQKTAKYDVDVKLEMVSQSSNDKKTERKIKTLAQLCTTVDVACDKDHNAFPVFYVDFDSPILLDPNAIKYNLVFRLHGPPSYELDPTKFETRIESNTVSFFFWPGSKQMPVLRFLAE